MKPTAHNELHANIDPRGDRRSAIISYEVVGAA